MMPTPKKKKPLDNFKMALGMGTDWVDLDAGVIYHIQEYKEKQKTGAQSRIRISKINTGETIGWADEYTVSEQMKDPEPDPRYAAETLREHRRNW